jgi:hypothetical protein
MTDFPEELEQLDHVLTDLMKRSQNNDPCETEDCGELLSRCCQKSVSIVPGTAPLQVVCSSCGQQSSLVDLLKAS